MASTQVGGWDIPILERAPIPAGATLTLTERNHGSRQINLDQLAGSIVTLPAATGSMARFRFVVSVIPTSNSHIVKVANVVDTMQGVLLLERSDTNAVLGFAAVAGTSDTVTLNRTTTGGSAKGEVFDVQDIAPGIFQVNGVLVATTAQATPFSATV